jgi:four helix bundle protein
MRKQSLPLKELTVYKEAHAIGLSVWEIVNTWNYFNTETLGKQFVRAADSISLNISEGYGRYHYKENKQFCYYSRGSLFETAECLIKAKERNLLNEEQYTKLSTSLKQLRYKLNRYIASIGVQNKVEKISPDLA